MSPRCHQVLRPAVKTSRGSTGRAELEIIAMQVRLHAVNQEMSIRDKVVPLFSNFTQFSSPIDTANMAKSERSHSSVTYNWRLVAWRRGQDYQVALLFFFFFCF